MLIWMSDIHLNFMVDCGDFYKEIKETEGDSILVTGDIGEGHNVIEFLQDMKKATQKNVYYVFGNHDYYNSSFKEMQDKAANTADIFYLPALDWVNLDEGTALMGVDGWGDCRAGDFENSRLTMSDWLYIDELFKAYVKSDKQILKDAMQKKADGDAAALEKKVNKAIQAGKNKIIIATHVPPFVEVCKYAGKKSTPDGLPMFCSVILGDTILPIAKANPDVDFLWLSGHTHSRVKYNPCDNMTVKVAKAQYYMPRIEEVV